MPPAQRRVVIERHNQDMAPRWATEFQEAVRALVDPGLEELLDAGSPPSSPPVQRLVRVHLQLMTTHCVREETVKWWGLANTHGNAAGAEAALDFGLRLRERMRTRLKERPTDESDQLGEGEGLGDELDVRRLAPALRCDLESAAPPLIFRLRSYATVVMNGGSAQELPGRAKFFIFPKN
jgi:hypothetical protein